MKIKTNIRAGAGANSGGVNSGGVASGGGASGGGQNSKSINNTVVSYSPPISRCYGL